MCHCVSSTDTQKNVEDKQTKLPTLPPKLPPKSCPPLPPKCIL